MKNVDGLTMLNKSKKEDLLNREAAVFLTLPLSDFDIIKFQNLFITPSIHYITTKNVSMGRSLINFFLSAFKHYHNIGCLTISQNATLRDHVFDFSKLQEGNMPLIDSIELFCIEHPYLNFVWIELTESLQNKISQNQIRNISNFFSSNHETPVVVLKYHDE